jgi:acyl dehydratase
VNDAIWFDDLAIGQRCAAGPIAADREAALAFARDFDPQPYHLDDAAAARSVFGGLALSGWHTAALAMRLLVEARPFGRHPILGLGVYELRWLAPVPPGDRLRLEGEIVGLAPSRSKLQGTVRMKITLFNQRDEPVYGIVPMMIVPRRPQPASGEPSAMPR